MTDTMDVTAMLESSLDAEQPDWTVMLAVADHLEETGDTDGAAAYRRAYEARVHVREGEGCFYVEATGATPERLVNLMRHRGYRDFEGRSIAFGKLSRAAERLADACGELNRQERAQRAYEMEGGTPPELAALRLVMIVDGHEWSLVSLALGVVLADAGEGFMDGLPIQKHVRSFEYTRWHGRMAALAAGLNPSLAPGWPAIIEYLKTLGVA